MDSSHRFYNFVKSYLMMKSELGSALIALKGNTFYLNYLSSDNQLNM